VKGTSRWTQSCTLSKLDRFRSAAFICLLMMTIIIIIRGRRRGYKICVLIVETWWRFCHPRIQHISRFMMFHLPDSRGARCLARGDKRSNAALASDKLVVRSSALLACARSVHASPFIIAGRWWQLRHQVKWIFIFPSDQASEWTRRTFRVFS